MSATFDTFLYIFFYLFPLIMLLLSRKFRPSFQVLPGSLRMVDLLTPYLLLSVSIQTHLANIAPAHLYFYILLSVFGILYASYLAFSKRILVISNFFRTWWRYTFIFALAYHVFVGGYGIFQNLL